MEIEKSILYKPYSLAVIPDGAFFECSNQKKGKLLERLAPDKASIVRWKGGEQEILFWNKVRELDFRTI